MGIKSRLIFLFFVTYIISLIIYIFISTEIIYRGYSIWKLKNLEETLKKSIVIFNKASENKILTKKEQSEYKNLILNTMQEYKQKEIFKERIAYNLIKKLFLTTLPFFLIFILFVYISVDMVIKPVKLLARSMAGYPLKKVKLKKKVVKEIKVLITTFNEMTDKIKEYERKLHVQQRITGWLEMSRALVHEISNFIFPIERSLAAINKETKKKKAIVNEYRIVQNSLSNIKELITNMKRFYRTDRKKTMNIDIINELKYICHGYDIQLINTAEKKRIICSINRLEFNELIINLIKNAFESIPALRIPKIVTEVNKIKEWIVISIKDNGKGIPGKKIKKIFEPDFSTKRKGMGLGLAIVQRIITGNNWEMEIKSKVSKGSSFIVKIPLKGRINGKNINC